MGLEASRAPIFPRMDLYEKAEPNGLEDIQSRAAGVNILSAAQILSLPRHTLQAVRRTEPVSLCMMPSSLKCEYNARHGLLETRIRAVEHSAAR